MLGTFVNVGAIILGSLLGLLLKGGIPSKVSETVMHGIALCVIFIGIQGSFESKNFLIVIFSISIGAVIGELIDIDKKLKNFGDSLESRFKNSKSKISEGFVTATLLYCVGAMAIVGSLQSGLTGNYSTLFSKSILDGVTAILFTSTLGIGVMLSSVSVLLYQGTITLCASFLNPVLTEAVKGNMTAAGSLIIIGLGLNMLGITKIKVANLLPAIFLPILAGILMKLFS